MLEKREKTKLPVNVLFIGEKRDDYSCVMNILDRSDKLDYDIAWAHTQWKIIQNLKSNPVQLCILEDGFRLRNWRDLMADLKSRGIHVPTLILSGREVDSNTEKNIPDEVFAFWYKPNLQHSFHDPLLQLEKFRARFEYPKLSYYDSQVGIHSLVNRLDYLFQRTHPGANYYFGIIQMKFHFPQQASGSGLDKERFFHQLKPRLTHNIRLTDTLAFTKQDKAVLLVEDVRDLEDVHIVSMRLNKKLSKPLTFENDEQAIGVQMSISYNKQCKISAKELLCRAVSLFEEEPIGSGGIRELVIDTGS